LLSEEFMREIKKKPWDEFLKVERYEEEELEEEMS